MHRAWQLLLNLAAGAVAAHTSLLSARLLCLWTTHDESRDVSCLCLSFDLEATMWCNLADAVPARLVRVLQVSHATEACVMQ